MKQTAVAHGHQQRHPLLFACRAPGATNFHSSQKMNGLAPAARRTSRAWCRPRTARSGWRSGTPAPGPCSADDPGRARRPRQEIEVLLHEDRTSRSPRPGRRSRRCAGAGAARTGARRSVMRASSDLRLSVGGLSGASGWSCERVFGWWSAGGGRRRLSVRQLRLLLFERLGPDSGGRCGGARRHRRVAARPVRRRRRRAAGRQRRESRPREDCVAWGGDRSRPAVERRGCVVAVVGSASDRQSRRRRPAGRGPQDGVRLRAMGAVGARWSRRLGARRSASAWGGRRVIARTGRSATAEAARARAGAAPRAVRGEARRRGTGLDAAGRR